MAAYPEERSLSSSGRYLRASVESWRAMLTRCREMALVEMVLGPERDCIVEDCFEYSTAKLVATGFDLRGDAVADELDRLVAFCTRQAEKSA